jgi:hypothetical protein
MVEFHGVWIEGPCGRSVLSTSKFYYFGNKEQACTDHGTESTMVTIQSIPIPYYTVLVAFGRACAPVRCTHAHPSFWAH